MCWCILWGRCGELVWSEEDKEWAIPAVIIFVIVGLGIWPGMIWLAWKICGG